MVEMIVVIYDKSYMEPQWWKCVLSVPQFIYLLEHCEGLGEAHDFMNMLGQWEECEEPDELQSCKESANEE